MNRYRYPTFARPDFKIDYKPGLKLKSTKGEIVILRSRSRAPILGVNTKGDDNMGWFIEDIEGLTGSWVSDILLKSIYEPI